MKRECSWKKTQIEKKEKVYYNVLANEQTSPYDYYSFNDSGKHFGNFCEYGSCNRIIEAEIKLKEIKNRSPDKWILGHLNIYSSKNKFDSLKNTTCRNMDILLISEPS